MLFWFSLPGIALSILAIVFGAVQLKNIKNKPKEYSGKRMATAGLVLGIVGIVIWVLVITLLGAIFSSVALP